jgi:hypothetical protein
MLKSFMKGRAYHRAEEVFCKAMKYTDSEIIRSQMDYRWMDLDLCEIRLAEAVTPKLRLSIFLHPTLEGCYYMRIARDLSMALDERMDPQSLMEQRDGRTVCDGVLVRRHNGAYEVSMDSLKQMCTAYRDWGRSDEASYGYSQFIDFKSAEEALKVC